jgi:hypothetical protein
MWCIKHLLQAKNILLSTAMMSVIGCQDAQFIDLDEPYWDEAIESMDIQSRRNNTIVIETDYESALKSSIDEAPKSLEGMTKSNQVFAAHQAADPDQAPTPVTVTNDYQNRPPNPGFVFAPYGGKYAINAHVIPGTPRNQRYGANAFWVPGAPLDNHWGVNAFPLPAYPRPVLQSNTNASSYGASLNDYLLHIDKRNRLRNRKPLLTDDDNGPIVDGITNDGTN